MSSFTTYYRELLLGVNIGGLGTLTASLASVISYKLYIKEYNEASREYMRVFTIFNVIGLVLFVPIIYFFMVYTK
jgi:Na+/phosphate symporter